MLGGTRKENRCCQAAFDLSSGCEHSRRTYTQNAFSTVFFPNPNPNLVLLSLTFPSPRPISIYVFFLFFFLQQNGSTALALAVKEYSNSEVVLALLGAPGIDVNLADVSQSSNVMKLF